MASIAEKLLEQQLLKYARENPVKVEPTQPVAETKEELVEAKAEQIEPSAKEVEGDKKVKKVKDATK